MDVIAYISPELLILVPVLYLIGMGIKRSNADDRVIPIVLGLLGMMLACLYEFATMTASDSVAMVLFTGIIQGVLCAAAAVYTNQTYKQVFVKERD